MIQIQPLNSLPEASIIKAFLDAFADERLIAFVFNGIGNHLGVPSAYDSGTGTLPAYRGRGLVKELLKFGEKFLKEHGIRQYVLEVLCNNAPAIHIYENNGFKTSRELICFGQHK